MPCLELDDGTVLGQSGAIYNYVCATWGANKEGFNPTDAMANYNGEATVAIITDDFFFKTVMKAHFMPDGEAKDEAYKNIVEVEYPKFAKLLEPRVPADGFLNGPNLSRWDILFCQYWINQIRNKNYKR